MFINFIYLVLNLLVILNLFSHYTFFFLNVEFLLFFLFIFIFLNIIRLNSEYLSFFLLKQQNLIIEEYYIKVFDLFYFVIVLKNDLKKFFKNLIYTNTLLHNIFKCCKFVFFNFFNTLNGVTYYLLVNCFYSVYTQKQRNYSIRIKKYIELKLNSFLFKHYNSSVLLFNVF